MRHTSLDLTTDLTGLATTDGSLSELIRIQAAHDVY